jgi:hypothetical protein
MTTTIKTTTNQKYKAFLPYKITLHVAKSVNREQVQHYIYQKYDLFQVYNFKYALQRK